MKEIVQWCLELGIACVSVYAFSLDNFRRPQEEVDALMELAAAKFEELLHVSTWSSSATARVCSVWQQQQQQQQQQRWCQGMGVVPACIFSGGRKRRWTR
jgi:undecaprenyl diphosphate synthase